jgi:protoheme IX farnesyltransferase
MMPVVAGEESTTRQIWYYSCSGTRFAVAHLSLGEAGVVYGAIALLLGSIFLQKSVAAVASTHDKQLARSMFKYSILYMMLLCTGNSSR